MTDPIVDTERKKVGQDRTVEISGKGPAEIVSDSGIEQVPQLAFETLVELEEFMNQPLKVFVYEPLDTGHEHVVQLSVNGKNQFVVRGRPQMVKRKYVEVLARSRRQTVSANGYKDANGEARNTVSIINGLQYPFQVMEDPDRRGSAWLGNILNEA